MKKKKVEEEEEEEEDVVSNPLFNSSLPKPTPHTHYLLFPFPPLPLHILIHIPHTSSQKRRGKYGLRKLQKNPKRRKMKKQIIIVKKIYIWRHAWRSKGVTHMYRNETKRE
jgi:hypothetical protein